MVTEVMWDDDDEPKAVAHTKKSETCRIIITRPNKYYMKEIVYCTLYETKYGSMGI